MSINELKIRAFDIGQELIRLQAEYKEKAGELEKILEQIKNEQTDKPTSR